MLLQLQPLIVCWLPCACQLNSRLIWLQIHHRYISLCWVSLMPHIKHRGGHRGNGIKTQHHREPTKEKKRRWIHPSFLSPRQILHHVCQFCGKKTSERKQSNKSEAFDKMMSVTQNRADEGTGGKDGNIYSGWMDSEWGWHRVPSLARSIKIRSLALEVEAVIVTFYLSRQWAGC